MGTWNEKVDGGIPEWTGGERDTETCQDIPFPSLYIPQKDFRGCCGHNSMAEGRFQLRCYYIMAAECLGGKKYIYSSVLNFRRRFVPTRDWGFELNLNLKSETVTETRTRSFGTGVRYS